MQKHYKSFLKNIPLFIGIASITFLTSCSSSHQMASAFGKRKYIKGHFSDPIATIKTNYAAGGTAVKLTPVNNIAKPETTKPTLATKTANSPVKKSLVAVAKIGKFIQKRMQTGNKVMVPVTVTDKTSELGVAPPENITTYHHGSEGEGGFGHHFMTFFAIYALLGLLWLLIGVVVAATSPFGAIVFYLCAVICFIVAVIYLVLALSASSND